MKSKLLLALVVLWSCHMTAQPQKKVRAKVKVGLPYKHIASRDKNYYKSGDDLISIKKDGRSLVLQKFEGRSLREEYRGELEIPRGHALENVIEFNNRILIFYSSYNRERLSEQLFYREVNKTTGQWGGEATTMFETSGRLEGATIDIGGTRDKFDIKLSSDSSKILITYLMVHEKTNDATNIDKVGIYVFDSEFNVTGGDEIALPYVEEKFNIRATAVDGEGTAYFISEVYNEGFDRSDKSPKDDPNSHIEIFRKELRDQEFSIIQPGLDSFFVDDFTLAQAPRGQIVFIGFYKRNKKTIEDGVFHYTFKSENGLADLKMIELGEYKNPRSISYGAFLQRLNIKNIHFNEVGELLMLAEEYGSVTTTSGNMHSSTHYYNNIVALKFDKSGNSLWIRKLNKQQTSSRGGGSTSFKLHKIDGSYFLFYFDSEDNASNPLSEERSKYHDGSKGELRAYVLDDSSGEINNVFILKTGNLMGNEVRDGRPSDFLSYSKNEIIFEVYKKKNEDHLVKVTIN